MSETSLRSINGISKMNKICSKCKISKSESNYAKRSASKDGLNPSCRACEAIRQEAKRKRKPEYHKQWYAKNAKRISDKARRWRDENPGVINDRNRIWRANNPDKAAAHFFKNKVLSGKRRIRILTYYALGPANQYKCARCEARAQEWHHWSYAESNHTSVVPVCRPCHVAHHSGKLAVPLSANDVRLIAHGRQGT